MLKLFGTSGIRGSLDKITPQLLMRLGLSLATFLGNQGEDVTSLLVGGPSGRQGMGKRVQAAGGVRDNLDIVATVNGDELELVGILSFVEFVGEKDLVAAVDLFQIIQRSLFHPLQTLTYGAPVGFAVEHVLASVIGIDKGVGLCDLILGLSDDDIALDFS